MAEHCHKVSIIGSDLPNIPWEEKPQACGDVVWRSGHNPIIPADLLSCSNSIFNSAVVPFGDGFAGVFRVDHKDRRQYLHAGRSADGKDWRIDEEPIAFVCDDPEIGDFQFAYDPRVTKMEDKYYVVWCNGYHGPVIGMAYTYDFTEFHQLENALLPYNRNGVLFPRKIGGKYALLSRPGGPGHNAYGDIFYSESPDLCHWGRHRYVFGSSSGWQMTKVGAGPAPIETTEGWLLIYHGVLESCNGFVYSTGAALLDLEMPWKVLYRTRSYILAPKETYERMGDTPNVVFPCAALADSATGRIALYYGGADTVTCLAYADVDELIHHIEADSVVCQAR